MEGDEERGMWSELKIFISICTMLVWRGGVEVEEARVCS